MPDTDLQHEAEQVAGTLAELCKERGDFLGLFVLAHSEANLVYFKHEDNFNEWFTLEFELYLPVRQYVTIEAERQKIETTILDDAKKLGPIVHFDSIDVVRVTPKIKADIDWRLAAKATLLGGEGINNQGRVRSDNPAPLEYNGLYFRSNEEKLLCDAFIGRGIPFAPLPVFLRANGTWGRIEPDFVFLFRGKMFVVEIDGASHYETPVNAEARVKFLLEHKADVRRIAASDCNTPEKAQKIAAELIRYFQARS